jgi:hypothetical protein
MACEGVVKKIPAFLDDLLEEGDYREVCRHLETCEHCRRYAASIGSLSHHIHALTEVPPPPDIPDTVLYTLKKSAESAPAPAVAASGPSAKTGISLVRIILIFASIVAVAGGALFFIRQKNLNVPVLPPGAFSPEASPEGVLPGQEAERELEKIRTVLYSLDDATPAEQKLEQIRAALSALRKSSRSLSDWKSAQWHYHLSLSSQSELLDVIRDLGLMVEHEAPHYLIFYVPKAKLGEFARRVGAFSGVVQEYGNTDAAQVADESVQVSVYLN